MTANRTQSPWTTFGLQRMKRNRSSIDVMTSLFVLSMKFSMPNENLTSR